MKLDARVNKVVRRYFKGEDLKAAISKEKAKYEMEKIYSIIAEAKEDSKDGK